MINLFGKYVFLLDFSKRILSSMYFENTSYTIINVLNIENYLFFISSKWAHGKNKLPELLIASERICASSNVLLNKYDKGDLYHNDPTYTIRNCSFRRTESETIHKETK